MNPVKKVRSGASRAWRGTTRTAKWATGGVAAGPKRAAGAIAATTRNARERARDSAESALDRTGATRALQRARSNRWVAVAWIVGVILVIAWIGWTIYATTEYGGSAGLGVLISWPAVIAALALIAAPFVALYLLIQRLREPAIAGINGGGTDPLGSAEAGAREETEAEAETEVDDESEGEAEQTTAESDDEDESTEEDESGDEDESDDD